MLQSRDKESIKSLLASRSPELSEFGVSKIGLFGSFARGEETQASDIDLLVDMAREKKTLRNFLSLNYFLEDLLGRKVELVTRESLSPYLGPHILKTVEYVPLAS